MEELEEKVEKQEAELAEERRENERLKTAPGAAGGGDEINYDKMTPNQQPDPYLQEELHEARLALKQANNEKNEVTKQLQDLKIELQGAKRESAFANNAREEV